MFLLKASVSQNVFLNLPGIIYDQINFKIFKKSGTLCVARREGCEALSFPAVTFEFQYVLIMLPVPSISIEI